MINILMVACTGPSLSNEVTNPASLFGFMNVTSPINCSQNGTRRMTEIKISLNHSINERNQGKIVCQNETPYFIATGWFICETHTKENHILNQKSFLQVSKMIISLTDGSKIIGINGLRIQLFPFTHRINATWSYSSASGMKTTKCYMDIQFHNSTVGNLTDESNGPCIKKYCSNAVMRDTVHKLCYKNTTNYFSFSNQDMNTEMAEPLPEDIHVAWSIHSPERMRSTNCFTHFKLQRSATENQEQNCVLDIVWLALFPALCIILLFIISCQLFKRNPSCHGICIISQM
ncbi:uncharacterized protein [Narcine bancroftii]|uniref:uncharacterized protein isoform X2 n=1 Tax=Narcine bancroftii TaxID=1343680 RepID=UPI00383155B1